VVGGEAGIAAEVVGGVFGAVRGVEVYARVITHTEGEAGVIVVACGMGVEVRAIEGAIGPPEGVVGPLTSAM
jgi:hypothetical protein